MVDLSITILVYPLNMVIFHGDFNHRFLLTFPSDYPEVFFVGAR